MMPRVQNELLKRHDVSCEISSQKKYTSLALHTFSPTAASPQETDAFRMKAIISLRECGIPFNCIAEALQSLDKSPITTKLDDYEGTSTLSQTLSLLPGTTISLTGSFKRDPEAKFHASPIKDSFKMAICEWTQTGFPHPTQHTGWYLPESLLPRDPRQIQHLPLLRSLFEHKNEVALSLTPAGGLIPKAMQVLSLKKQAFENDKDAFLNLHCLLQKAILNAAPGIDDRAGSLRSIEEFFQVLKDCDEGFDLLSTIHQNLGDLFITIPRKALEQACSQREVIFSSNLRSSDYREIARKIVVDHMDQALGIIKEQRSNSNSELETKTLTYLCLMGKILGAAACSILLQEFSCTLGFTPLPLGPFERKILTAVFLHLLKFHEELNNNLSPNPDEALRITAKTLFDLIKGDLALFEGEGFGKDPLDRKALQITLELESFYLRFF
jgi:hypothetical protein